VFGQQVLQPRHCIAEFGASKFGLHENDTLGQSNSSSGLMGLEYHSFSCCPLWQYIMKPNNSSMSGTFARMIETRTKAQDSLGATGDDNREECRGCWRLQRPALNSKTDVVRRGVRYRGLARFLRPLALDSPFGVPCSLRSNSSSP